MVWHRNRRGSSDGPCQRLSVVAIDRVRRIAKLNTGVVVPITTLFDDDGNKVDDIAHATIYVCGSDTLQTWFNGRLEWFPAGD